VPRGYRIITLGWRQRNEKSKEIDGTLAFKRHGSPPTSASNTASWQERLRESSSAEVSMVLSGTRSSTSGLLYSTPASGDGKMSKNQGVANCLHLIRRRLCSRMTHEANELLKSDVSILL
jgi:hypothetical protein